jgi:anaerobic selenocysteine-containing dehydrogenase
MNGLVRELFHQGWIDDAYVRDHTLNVEALRETVEPWTPEAVANECGIAADDVRKAARIFGTSDRVLSTVLQGFYQASQATASSCQVNNLHLLRGMIGRSGCGILQMNGQPTAQNNRECGADGDLSGFRNWANPDHVAELASLWNVDVNVIPHWAPPTHAMQMFRYVEQGSIDFLWISATNPAVSLPQLERIRKILGKPEIFLVVQDIYLTETARLATVVLPAAGWGEKTGTFTNVDRTVHLSEKAVEPPGEARSDFDIFLDYARRMGFTTKDGQPLLEWQSPEDAYRAWQECTRGRPCDYTGISYERLRAGSGIQWPCNENDQSGTERLYADGNFSTATEYCETYGHDMLTGAEVEKEEYQALNPSGRAILRAAEYVRQHEPPDQDYPLQYTTGRSVYHFHTRTKTARTEQLNRAAPSAWIEISVPDAARMGLTNGDLVRVSSRRGEIEVPARVGFIREGSVFAPFHYGYWDMGTVGPNGRATAANELTITEWDPISKQPIFKNASVRIEKIADSDHAAPDPTTTTHSLDAGLTSPAAFGSLGGATDRGENEAAYGRSIVLKGEEQ